MQRHFTIGLTFRRSSKRSFQWKEISMHCGTTFHKPKRSSSFLGDQENSSATSQPYNTLPQCNESTLSQTAPVQPAEKAMSANPLGQNNPNKKQQKNHFSKEDKHSTSALSAAFSATKESRATDSTRLFSRSGLMSSSSC